MTAKIAPPLKALWADADGIILPYVTVMLVLRCWPSTGPGT
jgi:hypothetical protein